MTGITRANGTDGDLCAGEDPVADASRRLAAMEHGDQCDCKLLGQALGMDSRFISFAYCHRVLQEHWRMTCLHGRPASEPVAGPGERWKDVGPVDPVKAILIVNELKG